MLSAGEETSNPGVFRKNKAQLLDEIRIQHFRSFSTEAVLHFRRGLNVIVGANGAGKSNVMDAILFALGLDCSQMRVRSWTEVTNCARRGPCAVTIKLNDGLSRVDSTILSAMVKDESNRMLRLNGASANIQALVNVFLSCFSEIQRMVVGPPTFHLCLAAIQKCTSKTWCRCDEPLFVHSAEQRCLHTRQRRVGIAFRKGQRRHAVPCCGSGF